MDTLRTDDREINHHGVPIVVGDDNDGITLVTPVEEVIKVPSANLRHRREDLEVKARKQFYENISKESTNKEKLAMCKRIGRVYIPVIILLFVTIYWVFGLSQME